MGRPTDYDPKYVDEIIDYFSVQPLKRKLVAEYEGKDGKPIPIYSDPEPTSFPSLAGFAAKIGVHRDTLHEWQKKHKEFDEAVKLAKEYQEHWLLENGLRDRINASFGIFALKNICGYRDKPEGPEVVVNNITKLSDEEIDARINELLAKREAK